MIRSPLALLLFLFVLVAALKEAAAKGPLKGVFKVLPVPFWCYVLPMIFTTAGLTPASSPLYGFLSGWALPVCLVWLLLGVDARVLLGLGLPAGGMMLAGFLGVIGGAVAAAGLLSPWLPPEAWKSLGALAGSWTGGSANMLAVKEALGAPDAIFAPVVLTDGLFAYGWMSLLMAGAARQEGFDSRVRARDMPVPPVLTAPLRRISGVGGLAGGLLLAASAVLLGERLPSLGGALSPTAWSVLLSTSAALAAAAGLSWKRWRLSERVEKTGNLLLLILVASLGARASLDAAARSPVFLAAGAVILAVHGGTVLLAARWMRAPLALAATASQCCLGGVVSGPLVAAVYRPSLTAAALLMAVAANAVGTYIGLLTAVLCRGAMG